MINKNFRTHDKLDDILGGGLGGPLHLFLGIEMGEEREDGTSTLTVCILDPFP